MNKRSYKVVASALALLLLSQTTAPIISNAEEALNADYSATSGTVQNEVIYASDLSVHGYVQKGMIEGCEARDNEPIYVRIFNGDWAEIATAEVAADGNYTVTASGSEVYHVKFECNGYLPFYLKDFGTGSYQVGSGDSDNTVTLVPGDTTYNADNDNQWSDDVLNNNGHL